ncbi:hypothetical protein K438DRAFT_1932142 [Mycena galopus ATCC 62051]|nr:hypothetical protein K438DRAFT_1932142 [Mycena galopus ATCC 62051]
MAGLSRYEDFGASDTTTMKLRRKIILTRCISHPPLCLFGKSFPIGKDRPKAAISGNSSGKRRTNKANISRLFPSPSRYSRYPPWPPLCSLETKPRWISTLRKFSALNQGATDISRRPNCVPTVDETTIASSLRVSESPILTSTNFGHPASFPLLNPISYMPQLLFPQLSQTCLPVVETAVGTRQEPHAPTAATQLMLIAKQTRALPAVNAIVRTTLLEPCRDASREAIIPPRRVNPPRTRVNWPRPRVDHNLDVFTTGVDDITREITGSFRHLEATPHCQTAYEQQQLAWLAALTPRRRHLKRRVTATSRRRSTMNRQYRMISMHLHTLTTSLRNPTHLSLPITPTFRLIPVGLVVLQKTLFCLLKRRLGPGAVEQGLVHDSRYLPLSQGQTARREPDLDALESPARYACEITRAEGVATTGGNNGWIDADDQHDLRSINSSLGESGFVWQVRQNPFW